GRAADDVPLGVAPEDSLLLERGAERFEVDLGRDHPATLQLLHPAHRALDVAGRAVDEVQEELQELLVRQERLEEIERELAVAVVRHAGRCYAVPPRSRPQRTSGRTRP